MGGEQSGYWGAGCHQVVINSICNVRSLKTGAPGTVWTWIMMTEFAMLSSMTGSPRYLFSIQGVSKSQTAGYIFCKLSNVVVRCAPIVNECLCISQNYLFATRFVRWVREGLSALQVWTLVWGLPGPGRGSCLRAWGAKFPGRNFGPILASGIFFYVVPAWLWFSRDPNYTTQYWVGWS